MTLLLQLGIWGLQLPGSGGQQLPGRAGGSSVCPQPHPGRAQGSQGPCQGLGTHTRGAVRPGVRAVQGFPHQLPINNVFPLSHYFYFSLFVFLSQLCPVKNVYSREFFSTSSAQTYGRTLKKKLKNCCFHFKLPFKKDLSLPDTVLTLGDC